MEVHANAPLSPIGRRRVVDRVVVEGWSVAVAAEAAGVTERTVYRWLARYRREGQRGLVDRRSVPGRIPHKTSADRVSAICALRQLRLTAAQISVELSMPLSTVSAVLHREGLGKRSRLEPVEPICRYERSTPGELIHVDVKKLGRIVGGPGHRVTGRGAGIHWPATKTDSAGVRRGVVGWEAVHIAIDDYSRLAYVEVLPDEKATTSIGFLKRAITFFADHEITVRRVMTDNGSPYRSHAHAIACRELGIRHLRTRPYRPQTNGKAERFIQTLLREWAYARAYSSSAERTSALTAWLTYYNFNRPHGALSHRPPHSRLTKAPRNYS
jgi:transposase InsO family protein